MSLILVGVLLVVDVPSAIAGTSTVTATDGVLRWDVVGDATNSTFHATSRADLCSGVPAPCVRMHSQLAPVTSSPEGCNLGVCPQAGLQRIELVGDGSGPFQITTTPGAMSPDYGCPTAPTVIVQRGSDGGTATNDGCPQTVQCSPEYEGRVDADGSDTIADACRWLLRDGVPIRRDPKPVPVPPQPDPTPVPKPTPTPTPKPTPPASSPLVRVAVKALSERRLSIAVTTRRSSRFTIVIERRVGSRWKRSATKTARAAKAQTVRRTVRAAGTRRANAGRYRVLVTSPGSHIKLVSSSLRLR